MVRATVYLKQDRPVAVATDNGTKLNPASHWWVDVGDSALIVHCRSEAQAILLADAINLPDAEAAEDPTKPADRRILVDDESPTFGRAREAAQAAGAAAIEDQI